ncbi:hypothetical protein PV416_46870, partial [Streptomyces ipomoeae]
TRTSTRPATRPPRPGSSRPYGGSGERGATGADDRSVVSEGDALVAAAVPDPPILPRGPRSAETAGTA